MAFQNPSYSISDFEFGNEDDLFPCPSLKDLDNDMAASVERGTENETDSMTNHKESIFGSSSCSFWGVSRPDDSSNDSSPIDTSTMADMTPKAHAGHEPENSGKETGMLLGQYVMPTEKDVVVTLDGSLKDIQWNKSYEEVAMISDCYHAICIDDFLSRKTVDNNKRHRAKHVMAVFQYVKSKGGRFLQKSPQGWYVLEEEEAYELISQAFDGNLIPKTDHEDARMPKRQRMEDEEEVPSGATESLGMENVKPDVQKKKKTKKNKEREEKMREPMIYVDEPLESDILYGRGGNIYNREGNKRFREIVMKRQPNYKKIDEDKNADKTKTDTEKQMVSRDVVHVAQREGRRFLKKRKDGEKGWYVVHDDFARFKASQALREQK